MTAVNDAVVLIHGGQHTRECWDPTVTALRELRPDVTVLAVDLPGRGSKPAALSEVGIAECVRSVVADIDAAGLSAVVLIAHSMGGVTMPGVAAALGKERVRRMVFVAAAAPPNGMSILDDLMGELQEDVRERVDAPAESPPFPRETVESLFCNGMTEAQTDFVVRCMCPESNLLATQKVDRSDMPPSIPRTWVLTLQDQAVSPDQQRQHVDNLGGVDEIVEIDTCHDVMVSEPEILAKILIDRLV
ncbi:alpha/beta fold hydrolase [Rhodococcus opacus]|uniref:Putative esterase n=1 Tax=Rhodococcus opacus (strain B4) TaxID=632772 RepID=C1B5X7_RHOOB|nr:alpha/beta fold hydrolase [Rhodococcus opacus]BAH55388.1 putative esterase [Rhodococcus opacus B4]